MAQTVPAQNSLVDIIRSATETVEGVQQVIEETKARAKKAATKGKEAVEKNLQHFKTNLDSVVNFIKDMDKSKQNIDKATTALIVVLGMPGEINKRMAQVKVAEVKNEQLLAAIEQLRRVLKTPAEINTALKEDIPTIDGRAVKHALNQIIVVCQLPEKINAKLDSIKIEKIDAKKIKGVLKDLDLLFGKKGFLPAIQNAMKELENTKTPSLKRIITLKMTLRVIRYIADEAIKLGENYGKDKKKLTQATLTTKALETTISGLTNVFKQLEQIKFTTLITVRIRIKLMSGAISSIYKNLIPKLGKLGDKDKIKDIVEANVGMAALFSSIWLVVKVFKTINDIKLTEIIMAAIRAKLLAMSISPIRTLIGRLSRVAVFAMKHSATILPGMAAIFATVSVFKLIITTIKSTKRGLLFGLRVKQLISATILIRRLIRSISRMVNQRTAMRALRNVIIAQLVIMSFANMITTILMLVPIMAIFIIAAPFIIIVMVVMVLMMKFIVKVLARMLNPKVVVVLVLTTQLICLIAVMGLALVLLALMATVIVEMAIPLLTFFGILALVIVALALIGFVLSSAAPYLMVALYGVVIVTAIVLCVLLIAGALWLLSKIELDEKKIKENVKKVITTAMSIFTTLFEDELNDPDSKDSWFTKIINLIGGAIAKIIMALAACYILLATVVAVACILLIAGMLRILQTINLDEAKIRTNVQRVMATAQEIIDLLFGDDSEKENKSNRGPLLGLVNWICPPLGKIIDAIFTVAYLFLMTIAILMVLAIAGMLRWLQEIDLDSAKIMERVNTIFDTADAIINRIFGDRDDNGKGSSRGLLVTIISWVDEGLAKIVEAALSVVYLFLVLISIGLVLAIAGLLRGLQEIDLDAEAILGIVETVFDTADKIIARVMAPADDSTKPSRGVFGTIIAFFSEPLAKIVDALMAIAYLGLIFLAVSVIKGIATSLNEIQKIELDAGTIDQKIDTIFKCAAHAMNKVYSASSMMPKPPKKKSLFRAIVGFFSPGLGEILDALMEIAKLATVQAAISAIAGIAKSLEEIQNIKIDLNSAYNRLDQIMTMSEKVAERIFGRESKLKLPVPPKEKKSVFGALIDWAMGGESDEDRAIKAAMKRVEGLGVIAAAVGALGTIQENVKKIMDVQLDDFTGAAQKVGEVMDMATAISEKIFGSETKITLPEPTEDETMSALLDMGWRYWFRGESAVADAKQQAAMKAAMRRVEALSMITSAVGSLSSIIEGIDKINKYEIPNVDGVKSKVQRIMQASNQIAFVIFNDENTGAVGGNAAGIKSQVEDVKAKVDFAEAGTSGVSKIADAIKNMMDKLNPIAPKLPETETNAKAALNLANNLTFAVQSIDVNGVKDKFKALADSTKAAANYCEQVNKLIEATQFTESQVDETQARVSRGIDALGAIIAQMDAIQPAAGGKTVKQNCNLIDRISSTVGSFVKVEDRDVQNSKNITENYIKFFKQIDSMDLKKLQHTDWLMRSWAAISRDLKGDFEGLAKTINANIMPLLEKVNETMDKATKCQQQIIEELTKPVDIGGGASDGSITPTENASDGASNLGDTTYQGNTGRDNGGDIRTATHEDGKGRAASRARSTTTKVEPEVGKEYVVSFATIKKK